MKHILFSLLLLGTAGYSRACTTCGCSASNQYLGILPQNHRHFIGLQYQYRSFESEHPAHAEGEAASFSKEYYSTFQVWGRFNATRRLQLFAFVPYVSNLQKSGASPHTFSGLGDMTVLANYSIIDNSASGLWKHKLQAGGGLKLPTGAYDRDLVQSYEVLPNMQPGTNSWDFVLNTNYMLRKEQAGINLDASYTIVTPNSFQYKYGNRFAGGLMAFYWYEKSRLTLLPQAGLRLDVAGSDYDHYAYRRKSDMSGGHQLYASAGLQVFYKRMGLQLNYHQPLAQHYAGGLVKALARADAGVYFLF